MEYTTIGAINEYISESINPASFPDDIFETYSVPAYDSEHPEYLYGKEIGSTKQIVHKNDVLICKINPRINRVWVVKDESEKRNIASSEWIVVRSKKMNPEYLGWYFRSPKFKTLMMSEVTGIGGSLTRAQPKRVARYPVPVVDKVTQETIVTQLNRLNNIVKARQQQLKILELLIKTKFIELFGDPISNPKKWSTCKLKGCLLRIDNGKSFVCSDKAREGNNPAVLKLSAVTYGEFRPDENKALLNIKQFVSEAEVHPGDLLFTRKNTPELVGMAAYVHDTTPGLMMPDLIFRLVPNEKINAIFLWQLINCREFRPIIQGIANGSAKSMSNISKERLGEITIICPPREKQNEMSKFLFEIDKARLSIQKSLSRAQELFDSLMQQFFI